MGQGLFTWKKEQSKLKRKIKVQNSLAFLPNELALKIFDHVSRKDLLNCRLTCWDVCMKINHCYLANRKFQLHEKWYKELLHMPLSFSPTKAVTVTHLKTEISVALLRLNFGFISELVILGSISRNNFSKLLLCTANLKSLKLGCMVLGGTKHLFSDEFRNSLEHGNGKTRTAKLKRLLKTSKETHPLPIHEMCLDFAYFPCSKNKGFCKNIIENLNSIHHLSVPFLTTLEFSAGCNYLQEKYMISISEIFGAIPKCCYTTLRKLIIIGPCFHFRHRSEQEMLNGLLQMKLQLNHFTLQYETKNDCLKMPNIISSFIKSQTSLQFVQIICNGVDMLS